MGAASGMNCRILLADDHALVRGGLKALIDGFSGFEVVGEAADGEQALAMAREHSPEVMIMDITMPGLNGLDACRRLQRTLPAIAVVVLSMHSAEHYVLAALRAGARAYVVKDAAPDCLEQALRAVREGRRYLSPPLSPALFEHADREGEGPGLLGLTGRQREILQLIAEGHATRDIATRLHISVKTVETHRAQLMQRLEIFDVAGLTRHAIRCGLVSPDR